MWNCTDCKFEEFFLSAWAVGDPAMVVDVPANASLVPGPKATKALYPDDPSNVHHSYIDDRVKFRNLMVGKEHHIFHLHTHQWQFQPNNKNSNYLDSQIIGPGSGYTYEIAFGGSGNRNKTVGDAIFHCHFYPHFAQGMWEMWRSHDTFERGTVLDAQGRPAPGSPRPARRRNPGGHPDPRHRAAAKPGDGPDAQRRHHRGPVRPQRRRHQGSSQVDADGNGTADAAEGFSVAPAANPGFPFYVPGLAGHRPPTAPLDIIDANGDGQVEDGGLPRHIVTGGTATQLRDPEGLRQDPQDRPGAVRPGGRHRRREGGDGVPPAVLARELPDRRHRGQRHHPAHRSDRTADQGLRDQRPAAPARARRTRPLPHRRHPGQQLAGHPDRAARAPTRASPSRPTWSSTRSGGTSRSSACSRCGTTPAPPLSRTRAPEPMLVRAQHERLRHLLARQPGAQRLRARRLPGADPDRHRRPAHPPGQVRRHLVRRVGQRLQLRGRHLQPAGGRASGSRRSAPPTAARATPHLDPGDTWTPQCPLARKHPYFGNVAGVGELAWGARTTAQRWFADPVLNQAWDQGAWERCSPMTTSGPPPISRSGSTRPC